MSKKTAGHNGGITAQPHFNQRAQKSSSTAPSATLCRWNWKNQFVWK